MKHEINIHNCEAWFLDYHENRLTPEEVLQLLLFLDNHPQFKNAFSHFENLSIENLPIDFPDKNLLLKDDAEMDLKLSAQEEIILANIDSVKLHDAENIEIDASELEALKNSKLIAGEERFENKTSLYKLDITHENIDDWLIAELEGLLNIAEQNALNNFIANNPQYADEQFLFASAKLLDEKIALDKSTLYKTNIEHEKIDENLIAYSEGILNYDERREVEIFLDQNPQYKKDLALYQQSKLNASDIEIYPFKGKLKRAVLFPNATLKYVVSGIAACLIIAFGLNLVLNNGKGNLADTKNIDTVNANTKSVASKTERKQQEVAETISTETNAIIDSIEKNVEAQSNAPFNKNTNATKIRVKQIRNYNATQNLAQVKDTVGQNNLKANDIVSIPKKDTIEESIAENPLKIDTTNNQNGNSIIETQAEIVKGTLVLNTPVADSKRKTIKEYFTTLINKKGSKTTPDKDLEEYELLSGKRKITDAVAWALTKVSGDRLKVTTMYNADDKLARLKLDRN